MPAGRSNRNGKATQGRKKLPTRAIAGLANRIMKPRCNYWLAPACSSFLQRWKAGPAQSRRQWYAEFQSCARIFPATLASSVQTSQDISVWETPNSSLICSNAPRTTRTFLAVYRNLFESFSPASLRNRSWHPGIACFEKWGRLRQTDGAVDPKDIVPAQHFFRAIEQLGIAAAVGLERELLYTIRRIGRHVLQDVQDLLLPGDLIKTRIPGGVELDLRGIAFIGDAALVLDVHFQAFTCCCGKYPVLRIEDGPRILGSGALHFTGGRPEIVAKRSGRIRRVFGQAANDELYVCARGVLHGGNKVDQTV